MVKRKGMVATKVTGKKRKRTDIVEQVVVKVPAATGQITRRTSNTMRMYSTGESTVICNTELLAALNTSAVFGSVGISLAPHQMAWLNGVAINFSKWRWKKLRLVWIPACPTTTTGVATIGLDYDYQDGNPTSMVAAQLQYKAVTFPYWGGFEGSSSLHDFDRPLDGAVIVDVDVNRFGSGNGLLYFRYMTSTNFNLLANQDKNLYSPAILNFSHQGGPAIATAAGNIFAHYEIEMIEPQASNINA